MIMSYFNLFVAVIQLVLMTILNNSNIPIKTIIECEYCGQFPNQV